MPQHENHDHPVVEPQRADRDRAASGTQAAAGNAFARHLGGQVLVEVVHQRVTGLGHRRVHDLRFLLDRVHVVDLEVEVAGLVDGQRGAGIAQLVGVANVGVFAVVTDGDLADGLNTDGGTLALDFALIVAVYDAGLSVDQIVLEVFEESSTPDRRDKRINCHSDFDYPFRLTLSYLPGIMCHVIIDMSQRTRKGSKANENHYRNIRLLG